MSVATQLITDDLRRWIVAQTEAGCRPEDVLAAMHDSGWAEAVAAAALEQTLRERLAELDAETGAAAPAARASKVPEPDLAGPRRCCWPVAGRCECWPPCSARAWWSSAACCPTTNAVA